MPRGGKRVGAGRKAKRAPSTALVVSPSHPVVASAHASQNPPERDRSLTPKQERFVAEYLVSLNATDAARKAGFGKKAASSVGYEYLRKPQIAAAVAARQAAQFVRLELSADDMKRANTEIVDFDPASLVGPDGNYLPLKDIPAAARRCLKRVRVHKLNLTSGDGKIDQVIDYEWHDKHAALDRDYKRAGLLKDRHIHVHLSLEDLVAGSRGDDSV